MRLSKQKGLQAFEISCSPYPFFLEAATGFEPVNNGFADRRLTTWLCRQKNGAGNGI
jgi:hypothetical protein